MDDPIDSIPPVVRLLWDSPPPRDLKNADQLKRYLRGLARDAAAQAEWTASHFEYIDYDDQHNPAGFSICADSGLDPFSIFGKCAAPDCRLLNGQQIARTLSLYADVILIPDRFTPFFLDGNRWTRHRVNWFVPSLAVLHLLRPLFEAGIFRFVRSGGRFCDYHYRQFRSEVDRAVKDILHSPDSGLVFSQPRADELVVTNSLHDLTLIRAFRLRAEAKARLDRGDSLINVGRDVVARTLSAEVEATMLTLQRAAKHGGSAFSNSRIALLAAREMEERGAQLRDLELWEGQRSATLPWVQDLSVPQVVQLRQEAAVALPRFRAQMAKCLRAPGADPAKIRDAVLHLRAEAEEVKAELQTLNLPRGERFRNVAGLLSLTVAVYGFVGGFVPPAMALGGLLTTLHLIHGASRKDEQEHSELLARPGYVLVKAQELLAHASQQTHGH